MAIRSSFRPGPEFKILGKNSLNEMSMATPAIVRGSLIVRTQAKLYRIARRSPMIAPVLRSGVASLILLHAATAHLVPPRAVFASRLSARFLCQVESVRTAERPWPMWPPARR